MLLLFDRSVGRKSKYQQKMINLFGRSSFVEYWRLNQSNGTSVVGKVNNLIATATGLDWRNGLGPKERSLVGYFDGVNDYVNIYSAGYAAALNGAEGSFLAWVHTEAGWTDGSAHFIVNIQDTGAGRVNAIRKTANNNELWFQSTLAGGSGVTVTVAGLNTNWLPIGMSWSVANNEFKAYCMTGQVGTTKTYSTGWSGVQSIANSLGSGLGNAASSPWLGWMDHAIVLNRPFTLAEWLRFVG